MEELDELTRYFATAMESVDARRPIASNARTGAPYSPGIGPHTERAPVQLVSEEMERQGSIQVQGFQLEVPYPDTPGINAIFASKLALTGTGQLRLKCSGSWGTTESLTITS